MAKFCKQCGAPLEVNQKFCSECGSKVLTEEPQERSLSKFEMFKKGVQSISILKKWQQWPKKKKWIAVIAVVAVLGGGIGGGSYYMHARQLAAEAALAAQEEAAKAEEARKAEEAKKAEETKQAEEAKKEQEAKLAEEQRIASTGAQTPAEVPIELGFWNIPGTVVATTLGLSPDGYLALLQRGNTYVYAFVDHKAHRAGEISFDSIEEFYGILTGPNGRSKRLVFELKIHGDAEGADSKLGTWGGNGEHDFKVCAFYDRNSDGSRVLKSYFSARGAHPDNIFKRKRMLIWHG